MTAERRWTIGELNRRASLAVVKDFRGRIWTVGELTKLVEVRGNRFMQLVERGGGRHSPDAHLKAFCSASRWVRLSRKLAEAGVELRAGQRLVVAGCLEIGDRGELSLDVDDVDVDALIGERLRTRQELVRQLKADDLFDANRRLVLPRLPLRVGVIASAGSDGHRDLMRQLQDSGFAFEVTLRSVPVEGSTAPRAIQAALAHDVTAQKTTSRDLAISKQSQTQWPAWRKVTLFKQAAKCAYSFDQKRWTTLHAKALLKTSHDALNKNSNIPARLRLM